ncbi:hypothetical protein, partial [Thiocapsa sp.]|uniref:hypothetical protein n=1 Tax=Thiocapsa sp. TaxID=2024551 RepID=UPI002BC56D59
MTKQRMDRAYVTKLDSATGETIQTPKRAPALIVYKIGKNCCRSLCFTGRFPNYFAMITRAFPALITPVAQCWQVDECEEREGGVW